MIPFYSCCFAASSLIVFVLGLMFGSFFNVCIYRIPLDRSVVTPRSHCAACGLTIPWYYNIPVLSWFYLKGKAACCGTKIDARYCVIEILTGVLFWALYVHFADLKLALCYAVFVSGLLIASFIDIDHFIIPDRFSLGGCVAGFICSALVPALHHETTAWAGFTESLRGAFISGIVLLIVAVIGSKVFKKEAMGMGDMKLMAALGAFLGATSITFILPVSAFIGSIFGVAMVLINKSTWGTRMPYGPFLALAAVFWIFGGDKMTENYWAHVFHTLSAVQN